MPSYDLTRELVQNVKDAATAIEAAVEPFTVIYYPRQGLYYPRQGWDFVVPRGQVDRTLAENINWQPSFLVDKHGLESSKHRAKRPDNYHGFVNAVKVTTWCKVEASYSGLCNACDSDHVLDRDMPFDTNVYRSD